MATPMESSSHREQVRLNNYYNNYTRTKWPVTGGQSSHTLVVLYSCKWIRILIKFKEKGHIPNNIPKLYKAIQWKTTVIFAGMINKIWNLSIKLLTKGSKNSAVCGTNNVWFLNVTETWIERLPSTIWIQSVANWLCGPGYDCLVSLV